MKKLHQTRTFLSGFLFAILLLALSVPAMAALSSKNIDVSTGVTIYVDGVEMKPTDANGNSVETFIYNGTTYVPIRAVSQYLGKTVDWDGATQTAYIGVVPGNEQYLLDVCPPYQTSNYEEPTIITMAGQKYTNGFMFDSSWVNPVTALFNLNGQYDTLEFDIGHLDGLQMSDSILNVYLDSKLAYSLDLTSEMMPQHCVVPLHGALQMKIVLEGICVYGVANITVK